MRTLLLITFLAFAICSSGNAQKITHSDSTGKKIEKPTDEDIDRELTKIELEPEINQDTWSKFLKKHINYDIASFNDAPRGIYNVKVKFTVFKDGHVGNVIALTHYGYGMEDEVVKALKKSPNWTPASQNGKFVNAIKIQTVRFAVEVL